MHNLATSLAGLLRVTELDPGEWIIDGQMGWIKWAALGTTQKKHDPNLAQPTTNRVRANPTRYLGSCLGRDSDP